MTKLGFPNGAAKLAEPPEAAGVCTASLWWRSHGRPQGGGPANTAGVRSRYAHLVRALCSS